MILTFQAIRCKVLLLQMNDANFSLIQSSGGTKDLSKLRQPRQGRCQPERAIEQ